MIKIIKQEQLGGIVLIYMDHAATTMLLPKASIYMRQFEENEYANPSGNYSFASKAKKAIEYSRNIIAKSINASSNEIFFTSGGTESDNWALKSMFNARGDIIHPHIITSSIEHSAILETCSFLEKQGCRVTYVPVDEEGTVNLNYLSKSFTRNTIICSIMTANNEIGTIQPIDKIAEIAHSNNVIFHTDAVQAYGHIPIDVKAQNIDLMSASAHKCNGPKGCGFLYINNKIKYNPFIHGGGQEDSMRSGTENVAAIAGFGVAAQYSHENLTRHHKKELYLQNYMTNSLIREIPDITINGNSKNKLANNINITIKNVNAESLLELLNMDNICISAGSACHTSNPNPSHVLTAIGKSGKEAYSTIRITIGPRNTIRECDIVIGKIKAAADCLRKR